MDLLFKRYASPFDYLDALLGYCSFGRGIANIWETTQDDKSWDYYLSNNPMNNKSFEDWKKENRTKQEAHTPLSKAQVGATVEKSQNILKNFNPLKQEQGHRFC